MKTEKVLKKLPDSELDIMLIIWEAKKPISRAYIESQINLKKPLATTTILSLISRLIEKGFIAANKDGKTYMYSALIAEETYLSKESKSILQKLYKNSIKNFVTALYDGDNLKKSDIDELQTFLDNLKEVNDDE